MHYSFLKPSPNAAASAHLGGKWLLSRPERGSLIVVSSPWVDGASAAAQTMKWLATLGMQTIVVVLDDSDGHADKRTRIIILAQQFANQGQVVMEMPFDLHLRLGGVIDVSHEMS